MPGNRFGTNGCGTVIAENARAQRGIGDEDNTKPVAIIPAMVVGIVLSIISVVRFQA